MSADPERRRDPFWPLLALVTLLGALVRVKVAATEPPHFDESYTAVHYVLETAKTIVTTYDEPNNHVFHNLLAWVSTGLFGNEPFALRLPALVAGITLIPATGLLARATVRHARRGQSSEATTTAGDETDGTVAGAGHESGAGSGATVAYGGGGVAGLVAAGIVAGAPPLIAYSGNARGYTIVLLLMVCQLGLTLRLADPQQAPEPHWSVEDSPMRRRFRRLGVWERWALLGAVAIWTVPTAVLGVGVAAIWLVALRCGAAADHRWPAAGPAAVARRLAPVALGVATTAVYAAALYSPVFGQRGFTVDRFTAAPVKELATTLAHAWAAGLAAPLIAVAVVLAVVGLWRRPRLGSSASLAVGLIALPLAIALLGRVLPYSRTYLFLLPILAVLAGVGAARLLPQLQQRGRAIAGGAAVALAACAVLAGATAQTREAWAEDPPGPSRGDLSAALETTLLDQLKTNPGAPEYAVTGPFVAPPFDQPQVQYALVLGLGEKTGFEPIRPSRVRSFGADLRPGQDLTIFTHAGVSADTALATLRLNPSAYRTKVFSHGDAALISAVHR